MIGLRQPASALSVGAGQPVVPYQARSQACICCTWPVWEVLIRRATFWEPGGDVIHYQDGNNRTDSWSRFLVTMMCAPGQLMLTLVDDEELAHVNTCETTRPGTCPR